MNKNHILSKILIIFLILHTAGCGAVEKNRLIFQVQSAATDKTIVSFSDSIKEQLGRNAKNVKIWGYSDSRFVAIEISGENKDEIEENILTIIEKEDLPINVKLLKTEKRVCEVWPEGKCEYIIK